MAFMEPVYEQGVFGRIEDKHGESRLVPIEYAKLEDGETCEEVAGWFCRLSANGYMDQTDWDGPFETEQEARDHIADTYDVDPDTGDELSEDEDA